LDGSAKWEQIATVRAADISERGETPSVVVVFQRSATKNIRFLQRSATRNVSQNY